jgi:hypothetical protein
LYFLAPLHMLALYAEGLAVALLKRDAAIWRRVYAPVLPAVWHVRAQLIALRKMSQRQRTVSLGAWLAGFVAMPYKVRMLARHGMPRVE